MNRLAAINKAKLAEVAPHLLPADGILEATRGIDLAALNARRRAQFAVVSVSIPEAAIDLARPVGPIAQNGTVSVGWLMNEDNHGWAYGNNARRLMNALPHYDHIFDDPSQEVDIALSFDIKVALQAGARARRQVLRVGGMRPLRSLYGNPIDRTKLYEALRPFDAVIVLNRELHHLFSEI
ncbi:MAG: hypothetical protein ACRC14_17960, partial [Paracoccaceae bacterium]